MKVACYKINLQIEKARDTSQALSMNISIKQLLYILPASSIASGKPFNTTVAIEVSSGTSSDGGELAPAPIFGLFLRLFFVLEKGLFELCCN